MGTVALRTCRAIVLLFVLLLPLPPAPAAGDDGPYLLRLERGDSIQVLRFEPATFGMFRYVRADSVKRYLPGNRVRSITDAFGRDVTNDVLGRRRGIGVDPLAYRPEVRTYRPSHRDRVTFPIFEVGVYGRLNDSEFSSGDQDVMMGADFGIMRNLSRSGSLGATVHLEVENDRSGLGLALRGRRWLGDKVSIDGSAGWLFTGDDERGDFDPYAFYGEAGVNLDDRLQLAARIESWSWTQLTYSGYGYGYGYAVESRRETLVQFGGRVGVFPGVPLFIVFLLGASIDGRTYCCY